MSDSATGWYRPRDVWVAPEVAIGHWRALCARWTPTVRVVLEPALQDDPATVERVVAALAGLLG